jgi:hypothetical protein
VKNHFECIYLQGLTRNFNAPLKYILGFCLLIGWYSADAQNKVEVTFLHRDTVSNEYATQSCDSLKSVKKSRRQKVRFKKRKGVAALFAVALGPFGVHRMYLGTSEVVPLFYSLTLGGLMILPIIDLCCILFTKDIDIYTDNDKVIMW